MISQVRIASIAVLKSTCFLASLRVRVKVAYFLGGVNGMLGLLRPPRDEALLQVHTSPVFPLFFLHGVFLQTKSMNDANVLSKNPGRAASLRPLPHARKALQYSTSARCRPQP